MKYRTLGKTGKEISLLSFGCMRFADDEQEAAVLIGAAIDGGVNYFETSLSYCHRTSERKLGLGVQGRRRAVYLSTKSGVGPETDGDEIRRNVEGSLRTLQTDYLDFYQFWGLSWERWDQARKKGGAIEAIRKLQDKGVVHHLGFTSHDTGENVIKLMATGEFESVTIHYHMLNTEKEDAIAYAQAHGIGIVVMCPVAGGLLAAPSKTIRNFFPGADGLSASAELALRFVWSSGGVTTAASGMENLSDLDENVRAVERFEPLTDADRARVLEVFEEFSALGKKFCTGCRYCMPCPNKVSIPDIFKLVNYARIYGLTESASRRYRQMSEESRADACTECGECEPKCPYDIPIITQLKEAAELFGEREPEPTRE